MSKRLSKLSKWLLVFVVLLVVGLYQAQGYWKTGGELAKLETQLAAASQAATKLNFLQQDVNTLEGELAEAKEKLVANETLFSADVAALEIVYLVVASARASGVELLNIQQLPQTTEKLVTNTYELNKHRVVVQGRLASLSLLLSQIEAQAQATWRIDNIAFAAATDGQWKMNFNILMLTRLGGG